jgi:hypothetical protein
MRRPSLEHLDTIPLAALVLTNLLPMAGVLWFGWDLGAIVVLYWLENLIIGFYTIVKMLHLAGLRGLFPSAFFSIHYGVFCWIHGVFVLILVGGIDATMAEGESAGTAMSIEHLTEALPAVLPVEVFWVWLVMFLSHGVSFGLIYLGEEEYRHMTVSRLMRAPYTRIAVLHVAIIAGGFAIQAWGSPLGLLLALIATKIALDMVLHRRSHRTILRQETST